MDLKFKGIISINKGFKNHYKTNCYYLSCRLIEGEIKTGDLIVMDNDRLIANVLGVEVIHIPPNIIDYIVNAQKLSLEFSIVELYEKELFIFERL